VRCSGRWTTPARPSRASASTVIGDSGSGVTEAAAGERPSIPRTVAVLADFGSTYTKVTLVDVTSGCLVAAAQAPTTVAHDVMDGFDRALAEAIEAAGPQVTIGSRAAASSAGGGLRIAAIGLVSDLTAEAARRTALNAGGRIELTLSGDLGPSDVEALAASAPDVVLFSGGTDGGQRERVLRNAEVAATSAITAEIVVACNREVADAVAQCFDRAGLRARVVENTMPRLGELNIEPARAAILDAFLLHVIRGKRLSGRTTLPESVLTATPDAVLRSVDVVASAVGGDRGAPGGVAVVDIGGATTDIHSCVGEGPEVVGAGRPLLALTPTTRTVEGDLGMRWSAGGVLDADRKWLEDALGPEIEHDVERRESDPSFLPPERGREAAVDRLLATSCVREALARHSGREFWAFRANEPPRLTRTGPDLRDVDLLVATGGVLARRRDGDEVVAQGLSRLADVHGLMAPRQPRIAIDRDYVLAATGLLSMTDPDLAARFAAQQFGLRRHRRTRGLIHLTPGSAT
jgi:uncharacterized protein (TIGR01319 family)